MAVILWAPGIRLRVLCVALIPLLTLGQWATPARAAGAQVSAFFTVSPDDAYPFYHAKGGVSPAPSNTRAFPSGVSHVYFYYAYSGASPGVTQFQAILYDASGNPLTRDGVYTANRTGSQFMNSFSSFSDGSYRLALYVDGSEARSTAFTVGLGVGLLSFDTISHADDVAWGTNQSPPARSATFAAGTTRVCFYVGYRQASARTAATVTLYDYTGKVRGTANETFEKGGGYASDCFVRSPPFGAGLYYLGLQIDGSTIAITGFSIAASRSSGIAITAFYTLPAGTVSFTSHPPRAHRYPAGTKRINYFFHFRGIAPGTLKHSITLDVPTGINVTADNSNTTSIAFDQSATAGSILSAVAVRQPFPPGVYRLELVIDGQTLATTAFTVD